MKGNSSNQVGGGSTSKELEVGKKTFLGNCCLAKQVTSQITVSNKSMTKSILV